MKAYAVPVLLSVAFTFGCADMGTLPGETKYGDTGGTVVSHSDRQGRVTAVEVTKVPADYKLGIGTAVGAVAGGLLGSQIGNSSAGTVAGAAVGAAAGTYAESRLKQKDAQRVTVRMRTGGQVTILQPVDSRLSTGMSVRVEGSGETARVVPS